ncbi:MAG: SGNH/GDSL hydrolase family protein [Acidimicrobiia bacterium]
MRGLAIIFGILAAIAIGLAALFTVGEFPALIAVLLILAAVIYGLVAAAAVLRWIAIGVVVVFLAGAAFIGFQAVQIVGALTDTSGPADPADPIALASATAKIDEIEDRGGFRLELLENEITAVVQDGLDDPDSPLARVIIDIVDGDEGEQGRLDFTGEFKSGGLSVEGSVGTRLEAGAVEVKILSVELGALDLPGLAEGAIEDIIEEVADLNQKLAENRADVQSVVIGNDRVVITGTQGDGELLTSDALLGGLRDQAASIAGAVTPPPERLGPGVVNSTSADGPSYYVALGDSLAANVGVGQARDGYVSRFHNQLQSRDGQTYGLRNFGVSGETSGTLIRTGQLDQAVEFMRDNDISYVTIDIGANDLLGHLGSIDCSVDLEAPACQDRVLSSFATYEENLNTIFDELQSAAPDATIVFLRAYNPFSLGFGGVVALERQSNETLDAFNEVAATVAAQRGIVVADGFTPMLNTTGATTHMLDSPPDIHPVPIGYDILAGALLDALA